MRAVGRLANLLLLMIIIVISSMETVEGVCPSDKAACDASDSCHISETGQCISSLPCALETTRTTCLENTGLCSWNANQSKCEKRVKRSAGSSCISLSRNNCSNIKTCYWHERSESCRQRPNIILSVADDLGWYDIGFNNARARTPVLDKLRGQGVGLDRHYTSRFCAPTRAMILTGRYPWRIGLQTDANLNPAESLRCASARDVELLPAILKRRGGYKAHAFGKWHLGYHTDEVTPTGRGFDSYVGYYLGGLESMSLKAGKKRFFGKKCACLPSGKGGVRGRCNRFSKKSKLTCTSAMSIINETSIPSRNIVNALSIREDTVDLYFAKQAADVINITPPEAPLFLYLAWKAPHHPVMCGNRHRDSIQASRPTFGKDARVNAKCSPQGRITLLGMIMAMDEAHRILIDALDFNDRFDNTILVFISDNGGNMAHLAVEKEGASVKCRFSFNYPLRGAKYSFWEGGVRTVGFVHSNQHIAKDRKGGTYTDLLSAVDWRKTLSSAAGIMNFPDKNDDGEDLWDSLSLPRNSAPASPRHVLPLQIWLETNRAVIIYKFQGELWKIMQGYPGAGEGAGAQFRPYPQYSQSVIEQPSELPRKELTNATDPGVGRRYNCKPYCLINLTQDPQEMKEASTKASSALKKGIELINEYRKHGIKFGNSGLCDAGFYATRDQDVTDRLAIDFARKCGGFMPWLNSSTGQPKTMCK